jgi:hypothetical protein
MGGAADATGCREATFGEAAAGCSEHSEGEHEPTRGAPLISLDFYGGRVAERPWSPGLSGLRTRGERSTNEGAGAIRWKL